VAIGIAIAKLSRDLGHPTMTWQLGEFTMRHRRCWHYGSSGRTAGEALDSGRVRQKIVSAA